MVSYVSQPGSVTMPPKQLTYEEIADDLEARIVSGEYPAESKLPSYRDLAAIYGVNVSTIGRAMALLRDRELVYGQQGRGVFVEPEPPQGVM